MRPLLPLILLLLSTAALRAAEKDIPFADFEGDTYGEWIATGTAFGTGPARGTLKDQMPVTGYKGKGLVDSFNGGDAATGTLTSPEFEIARKHVRFLIGGGAHAGKTCMNLIVDGKVVRTATGPNLDAGGSEELQPESWDVTDLIGKKAKLVIVDEATGGWGHISVDDIVFGDAPHKLPIRDIVADKKYLQFPVKNKGPMRTVKVTDGKETVAEFLIELADGEPDWWAPLDVAKFKGKTLRIRAKGLPETSKGLENIRAADVVTGTETLYKEKLRSQVHFSPSRGWMNDPNGMVYADGEWHLYFQTNPYGAEWNNMHWGHAVSKDLVKWEELPIALAPKKFGDWAFSGSAVVDRDNTSGWKKGESELLVGAYTSTGRGECIICSTDRGRTWTEHSGNPVVKHQGRDPRLLWHAPSKQWSMAVYDETDGKRWIAFYTSPDLKVWTYRSRIEGFFECPDLFELPLDGDAKTSKWVLTAASSDYMVGAFDGAKFTPETKMLKGNAGKGFYAAQTFSDAPKQRVIQMGWLQAPSPGMAFNQAMSVPLELGLKTTPEGPRLTRTPVKELDALRGESMKFDAREYKAGQFIVGVFGGEQWEVRGTFELDAAARFELTVGGAVLSYDAKSKELKLADYKVEVPLIDGKLTVRLFVDRTVLELFAADGSIYVPLPAIAKTRKPELDLKIVAGKVKVDELIVDELKSIWTK